MGRSLAPVATASAVERYDAAARDQFQKFGLEYPVERRNGDVFHREGLKGDAGEWLLAHETEVAWALGAGARGRAYLVERRGSLWQSPVVWSGPRQTWDLAPG